MRFEALVRVYERGTIFTKKVNVSNFGDLKNGGYYFTMELVEGQDLRAVIDKNRSTLPLDRAVRILHNR
jgi:hypothetical protein